MVSALHLLLLLTSSISALPCCYGSRQADRLRELAQLQRVIIKPQGRSVVRGAEKAVHVANQQGMMEADKIVKLPGEPEGVDFNQYAGYITVDAKNGTALFYYFVESPGDPSTKPLLLWLNGGPGCSSLGYGAMEELGPFRVNNDGKTLKRNEYAWNKVANVIFLESPAGVGFSYSNATSGLSGDQRTADDSYTFLVNWFERFPQYKNHEFFIAGESYAGHYAPDLANTIMMHNKNNRDTFINLKGMAIGNAYIDSQINNEAEYGYFWRRALISDETYENVRMNCNFSSTNLSYECSNAQKTAREEIGTIDPYNIYAPVCTTDNGQGKTSAADSSTLVFDPCTDNYIESYLNLPKVQKALHANVTAHPGPWALCQQLEWDWTRSDHSMLPEIKRAIDGGMRVWLYSGDVDSVVSVTSTQYSLKMLALPIKEPWQAWYTDGQVGGYVVSYEGLTFVTVRGAGHEVPSYQPSRALKLISSFLQGKIPE